MNTLDFDHNINIVLEFILWGAILPLSLEKLVHLKKKHHNFYVTVYMIKFQAEDSKT